MDFSNSEEVFAESLIKQIVEKGVNTVIVGGSISDICLHYMNKYDLAVLKIPSKFELQRVARLVNCAPINSVRAPTFEEIGHCDRIKVQEIGSTKVTIIEREQKETLVVSLVLRGSSNAQMENI